MKGLTSGEKGADLWRKIAHTTDAEVAPVLSRGRDGAVAPASDGEKHRWRRARRAAGRLRTRGRQDHLRGRGSQGPRLHPGRARHNLLSLSVGVDARLEQVKLEIRGCGGAGALE